MRSEDKQFLYRKKQGQLKLLVAVSLVVIIVIWLAWILSGGLTRRQSDAEAELFSDIIKKSQESSAGLLQIKNKINDSWQQLQAVDEAVQKQQEVLSKLKDRISEISTSSVTTTNQDTGEDKNNSE